MYFNTRALLQFAVLTLLVSACEDQGKTKIQYMPDMADAPITKAQREYLDPPEGAVAMNDLPYGKSPEDANFLQNPIPKSEEHTKRGQKLFNTFCIPCHGVDGKGVGTITDVYMPAPNLTTADYKAKDDSFFFFRISKGKGLMPGYAHAIDAEERWYIVHYLRSMQGGE